MIINKLDRLNIQRQSSGGNYRIIATVRDTVDGIDNQFNKLNSQNSNLIVSNKYNVVTERDCTSIFFSGNIGDVFTITYQQWVVLLGEESYYDILIDTITLQETTKLYYFRDDLVIDSYSMGEVDALLALKANTEHTHTIADIEDLDTTLSIIESDILLKADSDHNHDADYHPLNGSVNVGAGSWGVTGNGGLLFAVEQNNNNIFSTVPIYDESVSPRQGVIHTNRPNLDSINQDLATTDNVAFNRLLFGGMTSDPFVGDDDYWGSYLTGASYEGKPIIIIGTGGSYRGTWSWNGYRKLSPNSTLKMLNINNSDTYCAIEMGDDGIRMRVSDGVIDGDTTEQAVLLHLKNTGLVDFSLSKGLRLPNMTTTQRNTLTPSNGMMIYNTTDNKVQAYANGAWVNLH